MRCRCIVWKRKPAGIENLRFGAEGLKNARGFLGREAAKRTRAKRTVEQQDPGRRRDKVGLQRLRIGSLERRRCDVRKLAEAWPRRLLHRLGIYTTHSTFPYVIWLVPASRAAGTRAAN